MITRYKSKKDAEAFCRVLEDQYGIGVYHYIYKGHREYCVRHNDYSTMEREAVSLKRYAEYAARNVL